MLTKAMALGVYMTNCYIVIDEQSLAAAVIDPGDQATHVLNCLEENKLDLKCILLTHGHFDHTSAVKAIKDVYDVPVYMHEADADASLRYGFEFIPLEQVSWYGEGDKVEVGTLTFEVMSTPGHTPGSVVLRCGDTLFTGDTLFRDSCGRTDLKGGNMDDMLRSLRRLYELEGNYEVCPGHDRTSNLDRERKYNYYMRAAVEG